MTVKTPARTAFPVIPYRKTTEIDYDGLDFDPHESVEKPDAMEQHEEQLEIVTLIRAYFADFGKRPDVFVDYDTNICYDPSDLRRHVSPDVYIAFGVDAAAIRSRLIYLPWEAGKPPDFVMEIASRSTASVDVERKPAIYEAIGVPEYWMHDPTGGCRYGEPLRGRKLVNGKYQDIALTREPDGVLKGYSEVLGLSLAWDAGVPRLYDNASGRYIENYEETEYARRAADARADAAETQRDAFEAQRDMAEMQLEAEVKAREAAQARLTAAEARMNTEAIARAASEAENRRLRELIRRMENR